MRISKQMWVCLSLKMILIMLSIWIIKKPKYNGKSFLEKKFHMKNNATILKSFVAGFLLLYTFVKNFFSPKPPEFISSLT